MNLKQTAHDKSSSVSSEQLLLLLGTKFESLDKKSESTREKLKKLAVELDRSGIAYYPYAVLDGLSLSYSMFKYICDVFLSCHDSNSLHDLMLSPAGLAAVIAESTFIIGFSFLACHFDKDRTNAIKKGIAQYWPYTRDVLKGFKNIYKGLYSTFKIALRLGANNPMPILIPISLTLGVVAAISRVQIRYIRDQRKNRMNRISELLKELNRDYQTISEEQAQNLLSQAQTLATLSNQKSIYAFVAMNAILDSFYLYVGVMTLAVVSSSILWPLAILTVAYSIAGLASRLYEEYGYQQKFEKTKVNYEIAVLQKRLITEYDSLYKLKQNKGLNTNEKIEKQEALVKQLLEELNNKKTELRTVTESGYTSAFLMGLRHGMIAYGVVNSILFATAAVLVLSSVAFPPALMISAVISGLALAIGFVGHAMIMQFYHEHQKSEKVKKESEGKTSVDLLQAIDTPAPLPDPQDFREAVNASLRYDPSPQFFFQEWFEVVRSFFSGLGKGQRNVDFTFNALKESNEDGDYQDTPVMFALMAVSALIFAGTLAVRALAKGFGRNKQSESTPDAAVEKASEQLTEAHQQQDSQPQKTKSKKITRSKSLPNLSFFNRQAKEKVSVYYRDDSTINAVKDPTVKRAYFSC
jgi:hypothetical protein